MSWNEMSPRKSKVNNGAHAMAHGHVSALIHTRLSQPHPHRRVTLDLSKYFTLCNCLVMPELRLGMVVKVVSTLWLMECKKCTFACHRPANVIYPLTFVVDSQMVVHTLVNYSSNEWQCQMWMRQSWSWSCSHSMCGCDFFCCKVM